MNKLISLTLLIFCISCKQQNSIQPQKRDIVETVYASGKVIAENEYNLYALNSGTVIKKLVKEGDSVTKGQIIYIIKFDAPAAKLDAAKSNFNYAQSNLSRDSRVLTDLKITMQSAEIRFHNDSLQYVRLKRLMDQDIGTQSNVDNAYTNYLVSENMKKAAEEKYYSTINDLNVNLSNAKSQLTGAKTDLDNYFIRSDKAGTVYQLLKEQGEAVKANDPLALLGETKSRTIKLAVDQQDIIRVKLGQEVLLKTDVSGSTIYHAVISKIYPLMNEIDQTFRVDAVFLTSENQPYIHSSVEANIIIQRKKNALVIPAKAMINEDSVQIREAGKLKTIFVKTGIHTLNDIEILEGLTESSIVVPPYQK